MAKQAAADTTQQFYALKKEIESGTIRQFYLLFGKEHYFIDELCNLIMDRALPPVERDFGQTVYFGAETSAAQVVETSRQFPMMVSRQVVIVKEAQMMRKVEDIGVYFQGMMPTTVLVICYKTPNDPTKSSKNIDKRTSFYKQAQKAGVVFESNQIADYRMAGWIEGYVKGRGLSITPDGASLLAEYAGVDVSRVVLEVDKLVKIMPEGVTSITAADIETNVGMSRDYTAFELTKALSLKDSLKCFKIVHFFSESEKRFPFVMTMAALSSHFLKILRLEATIQGGAQFKDALAGIGVNPYFSGEYMKATSNYPMNKTMKAISLLKEYDFKSKSSERGLATDGELLQELVSRLLAL